VVRAAGEFGRCPIAAGQIERFENFHHALGPLQPCPPSRAVSDEEQSSGPGSFSGRGWAGSLAAGGQVRVRLWAVSRGRRQTVR
jgi:hypothetical protein